MSFDEMMQRALAVKPAPEGFQERVLRRVAERQRMRRVQVLAVAACLLLSITATWRWAEMQREQQARQAAEQAIYAVRLANSKIETINERLQPRLFRSLQRVQQIRENQE